LRPRILENLKPKRKGVNVSLTQEVYLIVGLGNPGSEYEDTRHNIGFKVIDLWRRDLRVRLISRRFQARHVQAVLDKKELVLLCPLTFMNRSGEAVGPCSKYYRVEPGQMLVIHDDIDLPEGRVKITKNSGAGGHKGVLSIIQHLGSNRFGRVKIGIGRPRYGERVEDYVLAPFYGDQRTLMENSIRMAVRACELFVLEGVESAMNQINCQNLADKEVTS